MHYLMSNFGSHIFWFNQNSKGGIKHKAQTMLSLLLLKIN